MQNLRKLVHEPELCSGSDNNYYQYDYLFRFDEKVYYTRINQTLVSGLLEGFDRISESPDLATRFRSGNLKCNYYIGESLEEKYLEDIKTFFKKHLSNITGRIVVDIDFLYESSNDIWVNYQKKYEHNPIHRHGGLYSFVWYLDVPEEIREENENQVGSFKTAGLIQFLSRKTSDTMTFNPKTYDSFIFNSDHMHQVYPFYTDNTRVSMAGNIYSITFEDGETITP